MEQVGDPLPFTKEAILSLNNGSVSFEGARAMFNGNFLIDLSTFKAKLLHENIFVWNGVKGPVRIHVGDYFISIVIKRLRKLYVVKPTHPFKQVISMIERDLRLSPGCYILTYKHPDGNVWLKTDLDWHNVVEFSKVRGYFVHLETCPPGQIPDALDDSDEDALDD